MQNGYCNYFVTGLWHYKSYRLYLILIMGLAILANTLVRATLSIGMVCMVNTTHATDGKNVTAVQSDCDVSDVAYDDYGVSFLVTCRCRVDGL